jgi:hypothetical protein
MNYADFIYLFETKISTQAINNIIKKLRNSMSYIYISFQMFKLKKMKAWFNICSFCKISASLYNYHNNENILFLLKCLYAKIEI